MEKKKVALKKVKSTKPKGGRGQAYPNDFKKNILKLIDKGEYSAYAAAKKFGISTTVIYHWIHDKAA
jgi:transposase-like protein